MSNLNVISGLPASFSKIALYNLGGLPISFYYGVVLVGGFAYLLAFTPLGRHMRFVGASREVSRLSGVRVNRIRFGSFVAASALSRGGVSSRWRPWAGTTRPRRTVNCCRRSPRCSSVPPFSSQAGSTRLTGLIVPATARRAHHVSETLSG